jgi:hypothetical protein
MSPEATNTQAEASGPGSLNNLNDTVLAGSINMADSEKGEAMHRGHDPVESHDRDRVEAGGVKGACDEMHKASLRFSI